MTHIWEGLQWNSSHLKPVPSRNQVGVTSPSPSSAKNSSPHSAAETPGRVLVSAHSLACSGKTYGAAFTKCVTLAVPHTVRLPQTRPPLSHYEQRATGEGRANVKSTIRWSKGAQLRLFNRQSVVWKGSAGTQMIWVLMKTLSKETRMLLVKSSGSIHSSHP